MESNTSDLPLSQETTLNNEHDVEKKNKIIDDIEQGYFALSTAPHKRRGKHPQLKVEAFDHDVYARNVTGFTTVNPVKWSMALERYIEENETVRCRWHYGIDTGPIYTSSHLLLYYETSKKVEIRIHYPIGVVMVQGENYKDWVTHDFPKVKECFGKVTAPVENIEEKIKPTCNTKAQIPTTQISSLSEDIEAIWSKIDSMNRAIESQDIVMRGMIERCQNIEISANNNGLFIKNNLPLQLTSVEKRIDDRTSVFMNTTTDNSRDAITELEGNKYIHQTEYVKM